MSVGIRSGLVGFRQGLKEGYHSLRAPTIFDKDCVLFLPLNTLSNRKTFDLSGYGNHGTVYGAVLRDFGEEYYLKFKGKLARVGGKGFYFDGIDNYISCGSDESLNITGDITIEMVFNSEDYKSRDQFFLHMGQGAHSGYWILSWGGSLIFGRGNGESYAEICFSVDENKYIFLTCVFRTGKGAVYVNGMMKRPWTSMSYQPPSSVPVYIASGSGWYMTYPDNFKGLVGLVRIYKRALSPREIKEHFELERVLFGV